MRWETAREPEWNTRQRALVMALALYEATLCRKCGEGLERSTDPMTDADNPEADQAWVAEPPTECFSCKALVGSEQEWAKADQNNESNVSQWLIHTTALVPKKPRRRGR